MWPKFGNTNNLGLVLGMALYGLDAASALNKSRED